jgi:hypothetical protein
MRYHRQQYPRANKPIRHEAMMAIKPKHVKMVKYEANFGYKYLHVSFNRFELRCIIAGWQANDQLTRVAFKHEHGDGKTTTCTIPVNTKHICQYAWADSTGPNVGWYYVKDSAGQDGLRMVPVYINDCMTPEEYELIRETIAWAWATIDSGTVSFPSGDYKSVSIK